MIERGRLSELTGGCKIDFGSRSSTSWKWHYSCPQLATEGDSEAIFSSPENYVVKSSSVTNGSKAPTSTTTITAKWLAADCGDLKPVQLNPTLRKSHTGGLRRQLIPRALAIATEPAHFSLRGNNIVNLAREVDKI